MTDQLLPKATLKQLLEERNLPTYGSRQQMNDRLVAVNKKPMPTLVKKPMPTIVKTPTSKVSDCTFDPDEVKFFQEERPRLILQGMTDTALQNQELKRRYKQMQTLKKKCTTSTTTTKTVPDTNIIESRTVLSKAHLKQHGLELSYVKPDATGTFAYYYKKTAPKAKAPDAKVPNANPRKSKQASRKAIAKKAKAARKARKARKAHAADDDDDEIDDETMEKCTDRVSGRLMKKCSKPQLKDLCKTFGVETSGSKQDLADLVAEQMTDETDSESSDSDDSDSEKSDSEKSDSEKSDSDDSDSEDGDA